MKVCKNCNYPVFSKGLCKKHWAMAYAKPIRKISKKQKKVIADYKSTRSNYLNEHPWCEARLEGCTIKATEIHHKKGKDNAELWNDTSYFMAICRGCHTKIEEGGAWVYERGFKERRF